MDRVELLFQKKHQKLADTQSQPLAAAEVALAKTHLATAEARLKALSAGPKPEELDVQEAAVKGQEAELRAAKARKRPDSTSAREEEAEHEDALHWKATGSRRQLDALRHARPEDVEVARLEIAEAEAAVKRAEAWQAFTEITAPIDGQVLKILTFPGEGTAGRGLLELGDTGAMVIKAELSVADAARVKTGARAIVTSPAWAGELAGTVKRVDLRVERSTLSAPSAFANVDRQFVEATIIPSTQGSLAARTGAEVTVRIPLDAAAK